jgi:hypothetical protein
MGLPVAKLDPDVVLHRGPFRLAEVTELLREGAEVVGHQNVAGVVVVSQFQREREVGRAVLERPDQHRRLLLGVFPPTRLAWASLGPTRPGPAVLVVGFVPTPGVAFLQLFKVGITTIGKRETCCHQ